MFFFIDNTRRHLYEEYCRANGLDPDKQPMEPRGGEGCLDCDTKAVMFYKQSDEETGWLCLPCSLKRVAKFFFGKGDL
jgi:hypothetical protein